MYRCCSPNCSLEILTNLEGKIIYYVIPKDNYNYIYSSSDYNVTMLKKGSIKTIQVQQYFDLDLNKSLITQIDVLYNKLNNLKAFA